MGRKTYTRPSFMPAEEDEDGSAWNTRSRASGPLSAAGSSELSGEPSKLTAASFLSEVEAGVSIMSTQSSLPTGSDDEENLSEPSMLLDDIMQGKAIDDILAAKEKEQRD